MEEEVVSTIQDCSFSLRSIANSTLGVYTRMSTFFASLFQRPRIPKNCAGKNMPDANYLTCRIAFLSVSLLRVQLISAVFIEYLQRALSKRHHESDIEQINDS